MTILLCRISLIENLYGFNKTNGQNFTSLILKLKRAARCLNPPSWWGPGEVQIHVARLTLYLKRLILEIKITLVKLNLLNVNLLLPVLLMDVQVYETL